MRKVHSAQRCGSNRGMYGKNMQLAIDIDEMP